MRAYKWSMVHRYFYQPYREMGCKRDDNQVFLLAFEQNGSYTLCSSLLNTLPRVLVNLEIVVVRDDHSHTHDCPSEALNVVFEALSYPACFPFP